MPHNPEPFRPDDHDLRHALSLPYARYLQVKAKRLWPQEQDALLRELRESYLAELKKLPIKRIWPSQWLNYP